MSVASIVFGLLLCGLSVFGMVGSADKIATAFVPMMFGIPLVIAGIISLNPHRGRVWMPLAALIASLGFLVAVSSAGFQLSEMASGEEINTVAFELVVGLSTLLGIFLTIWLFIFIRNHARRPWRWKRWSTKVRNPTPGPRRPVDAANPS